MEGRVQVGVEVKHVELREGNSDVLRGSRGVEVGGGTLTAA